MDILFLKHLKINGGDTIPSLDGTGPRKGSWMWKKGRRGKKAGHRQGECK